MSNRTQTIANHLKNTKYHEIWKEKSNGKVIPKENPYLVGNFAPTQTEGEFLRLEVLEGTIPSDIRGSYLRVGPNPKFDFTEVPFHAFDGDGFIHSITFPEENIEPFYVKRYVRTRRLITSEARGFDVAEMGEMAFGHFDYFQHVSDNQVAGFERAPQHRMGKANTNIVTYSHRLFSLEEQDLPYEIIGSWDPQSHIRTVGRFDFNGNLRHPVTAHPKVDPITGEMMFFGYDPIKPEVHYSVGTPDGTLSTSFKINLPNSECGAMMHDMVITEHYSLLFDMRLEFSMDAVTEGKNPWVHRLDLPARFGVLPRHAKSENEVKWINVAICAVFHFANAWEENDDTIVVVGCRLPTVNFHSFEDKLAAGKLNETDTNDLTFAKLHEWKLNIKTGVCISERQIADYPCDFVQVDQSKLGRKTQYVYAQHFISERALVPKQYQDSLFLTRGLLKFDLFTNKVALVDYRSANNKHPMYGSEACFAKKITRKENEEDSGYLVLYTFDEIDQQSECHIYKAEDLSLQCRIRIPERIPYGFHGHWVDGENLR